jgi:ABC-type nitrate/sulfonate/bicarbonate transport system ATPase subunit
VTTFPQTRSVDMEQPQHSPLLTVRALRYAYPSGLVAVDGLDFAVSAGEVLSIVGPSGCGKSTLLSLLAGMKQPAGGEIEWNEELVADAAPADASVSRGRRKPRRRRLSLVFQRDTVLPWKTVEQNVGLGLDYVSISKAERRERITSLLQLVRMDDFRNAYPNQLSGGMRRRVALLTGVAPLPHLLLLDEPFAALDEPTRVMVHADLLEVIYRLGLAVILVTHDLAEAITLGDRVLVLTNRPARAASTIETNLGHERDVREIRERPEYLELYAETWHELWKQTSRGPAGTVNPPPVT